MKRIWKLTLAMTDTDDPEHREVAIQAVLMDYDVTRKQLDHALKDTLEKVVVEVFKADRLIKVGEE